MEVSSEKKTNSTPSCERHFVTGGLTCSDSFSIHFMLLIYAQRSSKNFGSQLRELKLHSKCCLARLLDKQLCEVFTACKKFTYSYILPLVD